MHHAIPGFLGGDTEKTSLLYGYAEQAQSMLYPSHLSAVQGLCKKNKKIWNPTGCLQLAGSQPTIPQLSPGCCTLFLIFWFLLNIYIDPWSLYNSSGSQSLFLFFFFPPLVSSPISPRMWICGGAWALVLELFLLSVPHCRTVGALTLLILSKLMLCGGSVAQFHPLTKHGISCWRYTFSSTMPNCRYFWLNSRFFSYRDQAAYRTIVGYFLA